MFRKIQRIHLVGIGGSGMSGIAEVLLTLGYRVTGSDAASSDNTRRLETLGGTIFIGHDAAHVDGVQVVVVSSAVPASNPEVVAARRNVIPVIPRAEMLAELMRLKFGVAIAGAHGKTTTTSLVAAMLAHAGLDPTFVVGGKVDAMGTHARLGKSDVLIAEADESDGSFLRLSPAIAVVTTLDREHLDYYGSMDRLLAAFLEFVNKIPFYGVAVLCGDDPYLRALLPQLRKRYVTYGRRASSDAPRTDLHATEIAIEGWSTTFRVRFHGQSLGAFRLNIPGVHNVSNALAAIGVGLELDVPLDLIRSGVASFSGVERRFHLRGERNGVMVVDDYGHHPTEIRLTLATAAAIRPGRLVAIFQPHRYSRTRELLDDFANAFAQADVVYVTPIYAAGEDAIDGVSGELLAGRIRATGHPAVRWAETPDALIDHVVRERRAGDMVLTLGAGDIWKVGVKVLEVL